MYCIYREAFNVIVLFWLFCGVLLLLLTQTVVKDEAAVQQAVREALTNPLRDPHCAEDFSHSAHNPLGIHLLKSEMPPSSGSTLGVGGSSRGGDCGGGGGGHGNNYNTATAEVDTGLSAPNKYDSI